MTMAIAATDNAPHPQQAQQTGGAKPPKPRKYKAGLSRTEESRLRVSLLKGVPSSPWVDAQFVRFEDVDRDGNDVVYRFHNPKAFPPPGMVPCAVCGIPHPPEVTGTAQCLDHVPPEVHRAFGPSPSAQTIIRLREMRAAYGREIRIEQAKLPPVSTKALRKLIAKAARAN